MKVVTVYGYHGHTNLGDDLFLRSTLRWLSSAHGTERVYLNAVDGVVGKSLEGVDVISFDRLHHLVARLQWIRVLFYSLRSDGLVLSSGSILKIQPFSLIYVVLFILRSIKGKRFPILGLGVSLGPFQAESDASWCARFLRYFDCLLLRDVRSHKWVEKVRPDLLRAGTVRKSCDMALMWNVPLAQATASDNGRLGMAINRDLFFSGSANFQSVFCENILNIVADWAREDSARSVRFVVVCDDPKDGDREISTRCMEGLIARGVRCDAVYHESMRVDETIQALSECGLVFASRMHAGILAILAGVPVLQYSYARKIEDYFNDMEVSLDLLCRDRESLPSALRSFLNEGRHKQNMERDVLLARRSELAADFKVAEGAVNDLVRKC